MKNLPPATWAKDSLGKTESKPSESISAPYETGSCKSSWKNSRFRPNGKLPSSYKVTVYRSPKALSLPIPMYPVEPVTVKSSTTLD